MKERTSENRTNQGIDVNQTKIKGGSQSGRKVVPHDSKSDLPLRNENYLAFGLTRAKKIVKQIWS